MPDGLVLWLAGLVCLAVFVAIVVREDRRLDGIATPHWQGWLVLALGCLCILAGTVLLAVSVFSG
jgi:drug/metabolite transporter (DMT)-like permease